MRASLREIVRGQADGVPGSTVKAALCRVLPSGLDERAYGCRSFQNFLRRMSDVVRVKGSPSGNGNLRVYAAAGNVETDAGEAGGGVAGVIRSKRFRTLGHEADARRRRKTLSRLFDAIGETGQPFTPGRLHEALRVRWDGPAPPSEEILRYVRVLVRGGALVAEPGQEGLPLGERRLSLEADQKSPTSLILAYESKVVATLVECVGDLEIGASDVAVALGLEVRSVKNLAWCLGLLDQAGGIAEIDPPADADALDGFKAENARIGLDDA